MCRRCWGILWAYSCRSIPCSDHQRVFSHGFRMSEAMAAASLGVIGSNVSLPEKSCLPSRRRSWWTPMFRGWVSEQHRASTEKLKCHWKSWERPEKVKIEEVKRMKKTWKRPKLAKNVQNFKVSNIASKVSTSLQEWQESNLLFLGLILYGHGCFRRIFQSTFDVLIIMIASCYFFLCFLFFSFFILKVWKLEIWGLAVFEDSGWYKPDMSAADPVVKGVHWGYKQGCNFATGKCLDDDTPVSKVFCSDPNAISCSLDRKSVKSCDTCKTITRSFCTFLSSKCHFFQFWATAVMQSVSKEIGSAYASLPAVYSYTSTNRLGGSPEMDYCPHFAIGLTNRALCGCLKGNVTVNLLRGRQMIQHLTF